MIARPKISRHEWKTTEIGAFEVGNFAPFSCPGNKDAARGLRTIADLKRKQDAKDRETFALDKLAKALHDDAAPAAAPAD